MVLSSFAAIHIAVACAAIGTMITTAETIRLWVAGAFGHEGLWSWRLIKEGYSPSTAALLAPIMSESAVLIILMARFLCSVSIIVLYVFRSSAIGPLFSLVLIHIFMRLRSKWGGEGGDQMITLVVISGLVADTWRDESAIVNAAALFIGAQITLSYVASGTAKLFGPLWRSGHALQKIMTQYTYGHHWLSQLLIRFPILGRILCYSLILFDASFFLFIVLPMPIALIYPIGGIVFHGAISFFMRLNLFFIVFVGTYPCLFFTREVFRSWLRL